jgi:hypothetical protein
MKEKENVANLANVLITAGYFISKLSKSILEAFWLIMAVTLQ